MCTICKDAHTHPHTLSTDVELLLEAATPDDVSHVALLLWWVGDLMGLMSSSSTLWHEITSFSPLFVFSSSLPPSLPVFLARSFRCPQPPSSFPLRPPSSTSSPSHSFLTNGGSNGAAVTLTVGQRPRTLVKTSGGTTVARLRAACGDHVTPSAPPTVSLHVVTASVLPSNVHPSIHPSLVFY